MSTYSPPTFPRRPKISTPLSDLRYNISLAYYRYQVNTGLYVMSPGEKLAFNLLVLLLVVLLLGGINYCLPRTLVRSTFRVAFSGLANKQQMVEVRQSVVHARAAGDAMASLMEGGDAVNRSMTFSPMAGL